MSTTKKLSERLETWRKDGKRSGTAFNDYIDMARELEERAAAAERELATSLEIRDVMREDIVSLSAEVARLRKAVSGEEYRAQILASDFNRTRDERDALREQLHLANIDAANESAENDALRTENERLRRGVEVRYKQPADKLLEIGAVRRERDALRAKLDDAKARIRALPQIFGSVAHTKDPVADILAILDKGGSK